MALGDFWHDSDAPPSSLIVTNSDPGVMSRYIGCLGCALEPVPDDDVVSGEPHEKVWEVLGNVDIFAHVASYLPHIDLTHFRKAFNGMVMMCLDDNPVHLQARLIMEQCLSPFYLKMQLRKNPKARAYFYLAHLARHEGHDGLMEWGGIFKMMSSYYKKFAIRHRR